MIGIGGTGRSGQTRGTVGVTPTGIELGIDVGIGQLGISTDYGGGIVIGLGGQKIVWGREGGKISYNVGGLQLTVEARDCVVVETRKIAGQVVSRHTYPDPGCKLPPEDKKPEKPSTPAPDEGINPDDITDPADGYVLIGQSHYTSFYTWPYASAGDDKRGRRTLQGLATVGCDTLPGVVTPPLFYQWWSIPVYLNIKSEGFDKTWKDGGFVDSTSKLAIYSTSGANTYFTQQEGIGFRYTTFQKPGFQQSTGPYPPNLGGLVTAYVAFGSMRAIARWVKAANTPWWGGPLQTTHIINKVIPLGKPEEPPISYSFPPPGNQPPMLDKCCEAVKADLEDIKEVLATKEILAGKMTFPWKWRMPGGEGDEVIMDYPNLARAIAQMIDHLGIHPPKLSIKDANNAIAGDQGLGNQFPSVTQGFEALMAQVWDSNSDVDTLTNILYRLSWLNVQQSMTTAKIAAKVQVISDMLGGETEPSESAITTPFNIGAGIKEKSSKGRGFGKNQGSIDSKIDANTEIVTESLLPDFLKVRENPITIERYSGGADLNDKIDMIILKLESLQRG